MEYGSMQLSFLKKPAIKRLAAFIVLLCSLQAAAQVNTGELRLKVTISAKAFAPPGGK
jgi:hypothetical protein